MFLAHERKKRKVKALARDADAFAFPAAVRDAGKDGDARKKSGGSKRFRRMSRAGAGQTCRKGK
ncbi:hypothetical protein A5N82_12750 [Christensenella minuta]|uniref:Uncharacterized protein n=1 Tax=Christensenella minuta TaxID=626937 RepID=A0A136Q8Z4_9FIRM|nr:hypothetical protein B1H56_11645 [Christensenella minuta]KXK67046.1 hypothetical protein HMPREF3293_00059 [Christensenella minuta]OAQ39954.1 hypothetical protein A5N82_12750 [Christensenella minuta]